MESGIKVDDIPGMGDEKPSSPNIRKNREVRSNIPNAMVKARIGPGDSLSIPVVTW
jgi:hypothetical protein